MKEEDLEIEFSYLQRQAIIQCKLDDKVGEVLEKFSAKVQKSLNEFYFLYNGKPLNKELKLREQANREDIKRQKMTILVNDLSFDENETISKLEESKIVICPECKERARILIKDYKITLYDCKNGHKLENIFLPDFEKTQGIDESKIICNICEGNNKRKSYQNTFFYCNSCKKNLCPLCKSKHDKTHFIIDYEQQNFKCLLHNDSLFSYCETCKKDLCNICEKEHIDHKITTYGRIMPDIPSIKEDLQNTRAKIDEFKKNIEAIANKVNITKINENLDIYYLIYEHMVNNYDPQNRNYFILQNLNYMNSYNKKIVKILEEIINTTDKENMLLDMYIKMTSINEEDTYDNFKISKISKEKEIYCFEKAISSNFNLNRNLLKLKDGRILLTGTCFVDGEEEKYGLMVFDPKNDHNCDIKIKFDRIDNHKIIQMEDGNIILHNINKELKVINIKGNEIETLQCLKEINEVDYLFKLSSDKILLIGLESNLDGKYPFHYRIYSYDKKELTQNLDYIDKNEKIMIIYGACLINENEVAILCQKPGKHFGSNNVLFFYDINLNKIIKTIKIDKTSYIPRLCLINQNELVVFWNPRFVLVDVNEKVIKDEISFEVFKQANSIISLNDKKFLLTFEDLIFLYEIENGKIKNKEKTPLKNSFLGKYPGNKLIVEDTLKLSIYG